MELRFTLIIIFANNLFQLSSNEHVCGRPNGMEFRLEEDRVVSGYDIGYYRYPWYAALMRYGSVSCGGALIGPKTVVSAAHCFKEFFDIVKRGFMKLEEAYTIKLGVYNICVTETTAREYKAEKVYIHELYYTKKPYYDISLIRLAGDTTAYLPICLPPPHVKNKPPDGTVPGLGTLRYHGAMPCTVHEARLLIHNDTECFNMINSTGNDPNLIHNAFCAGYLQGGIDTCQGDSGGPLQVMNSNGDFYLIGIVSFGFRCADPGLLGMYTDVSEYLDWIQEKSGLKSEFFHNPPGSIPGTKPHGTSQIIGKPPGHHKPRPYRRPIKIIIYKDNQWTVTMKSLLHHPIVRIT